VVDEQPANSLLAAYFVRRDDLKRFFLARTGSSTDAEDLLQELYLKVAAVDGREQVRIPAAYLYRLASNMMLDRLRQQRRSLARDSDYRAATNVTVGPEDVADLPRADDAVAARQRLARIMAALADLPERTQQVFGLHKFEGLSHVETAARLGISRSAVEKHVSAALSHLLTRIDR
jgi:RNA polymerase sigma factor (sigma-70 family)